MFIVYSERIVEPMQFKDEKIEWDTIASSIATAESHGYSRRAKRLSDQQ